MAPDRRDRRLDIRDAAPRAGSQREGLEIAASRTSGRSVRVVTTSIRLPTSPESSSDSPSTVSSSAAVDPVSGSSMSRSMWLLGIVVAPTLEPETVIFAAALDGRMIESC